MATSDVFVELIDLLKKPVDLAGDIIREPLKMIETEMRIREGTAEEREAAKLELKKQRAEYALRKKEGRENAKLERDISKWEEDVRNLRSKNELARHKKLLDMAGEFAEKTARTFADIQDSISTMETQQLQNVKLVQEEWIKRIKQLHQEEETSVYRQMEEALKVCPDNEAIRERLVYSKVDEKLTQLIKEDAELIEELNESIKRIEDSHAGGTKDAREEAKRIYRKLTNGIDATHQLQNAESPKALEDGSVVETTLANDGAES